MMKASKLLTLGILGGSSSFSPLSIPGLALWLDASDASTLFQASNGTTPATVDGDVVGYWGDKSGSGRNATQSTAINKPVLKLGIQGGRNVVRCDGGNDGLSLATSSGLPSQAPITLCVVSSASAAASKTIIGFVNGGFGLGQTDEGVGNTRFTTFGVQDYDFASGWTVGAGGFVHVVTLGTNHSAALRINGGSGQTVTGTNPAILSTDAVGIGKRGTNSAWWSGDISEILAYGSFLTAAQITTIEQYFAAKWGITLA